MDKLPKEYKDKMMELLDDEYDAYLDSFNDSRTYALRVNNAKISNEEFERIAPFKLTKIDWIDNGYYYDENDKPAKHPYYYAGLYYLQDPSAMTPAKVMDVKEGDYVLDTCAAPGGKSTELASRIGDSGLLISNDVSASRCQALLKNLELAGAKNTYVISEDINKLSHNFDSFFDKILIDAPCSGEGMFRKEPSIINDWLARGPKYYRELQNDIINNCIKMLKAGGELVYSTCTFDPLEDEDIILDLLNQYDDLSLVDLNYYQGFKSGVNGLKECIRLYPHRLKGEGHFVAKIKKVGEIKHQTIINNYHDLKDEKILEFLKLVKMEFSLGKFEIKNDKLYYLPNIDMNLKGLRIIRSGLLLGEIKKHNFEPSQALAMSLKKDEFENVIDFDVDDKRVISYLKGETLDVRDKDVKDGYNLVLVNGYPLGFAKISNHILKNKYAKGWRYQ